MSAATELRTGHAWGALADDAAAVGLLEEALAAADVPGASFADARLIEAEEARLYTDRNGDLDERTEHNAGIGVRVLVDGAWGFASLPLDGPGAAGTSTPRAAAVRAVRAACSSSPSPSTYSHPPAPVLPWKELG